MLGVVIPLAVARLEVVCWLLLRTAALDRPAVQTDIESIRCYPHRAAVLAPGSNSPYSRPGRGEGQVSAERLVLEAMADAGLELDDHRPRQETARTVGELMSS